VFYSIYPATPATTTPLFCTPPPTTTITPPPIVQAVVWPDITIVLDTSADLTTPDSNALNDRGFETVCVDILCLKQSPINILIIQIRTFLSHTLVQYKISPDNTRVAIVTFDQSAKVVFRLNQYTDWNGLYQAIGQYWTYGPSGTHTADRNMNAYVNCLLNDHSSDANFSGRLHLFSAIYSGR